jgi:signal-transduction protein with cAMP-binding, CBS, and nucleotidyltransferase domain
VDLARICAFEAGLFEVNTCDRIEKVSQFGKLSEPSSRNLRDAFSVIQSLQDVWAQRYP